MRAILATAAVAAAAAAPAAAPAAPAPAAVPVAAAAPAQPFFQAYSRNPDGGGGFRTRAAAPAPETHVHDDGHAHAPAPEEAQAVRRSTARPQAARGATFRTPEAAMRALAAAYNARDLAALKHVTTPDARVELENMRTVATDLRLTSCEWGDGVYTCVFTHAFPKAKGTGKAWLRVAPASKPGWYMTVLEGCG